MFSLRTHAIIFGALLALVIGIAILGNVLEAAGTLPTSRTFQLAMQVTFFSLVIALALAAIPTMVKAVIAAQIKVGNADQPFIKAVIEHQNNIIVVMWLIMIFGIAIAIPTAIEDGLFDEPAGVTDDDNLG